MRAVFKRIMLKLSGEGLSSENGFGVDSDAVEKLAKEVAEVSRSGVQVCLVVGGGNFFRGAANACKDMDRSVADQIGMLATVINALTLKSALNALKVEAEIFSGLSVPDVCENYNFAKALRAVESGVVTIFAGGTGSPYFTTDSGAALRAVEMHCDVVMKATQVDGIYDSDPRKNPNARRFQKISYDEVIKKQLKVMDMTAVSVLRDNNVPIMIFKQKDDNSIIKAVCGEQDYSIIK